ncbi:MAG: serine/threonine protein kinase [Leptolyngbya sp. SIO1E4]|nr:serine/threonine protein kinase [Leptolyngbya sp. SIO1E4]
MHEAQQIGTIIQNRYQLLGVLGQGGSGITYGAEDRFTGRRVALKALSLKGLSDWKKLELFEREAKVLAGLDHPAIPNYVDYFQIDTVDNRFFYIAQALAEGTSLSALVAAGERFSESEVRRIALEILQVLQYLHGLNPPIIHRDIKPQNIIRRDDGHIFLVDFGAVQTVYRDTMAFGSTVVGTYGYMAPEQFRGQAYPTTDLYGLGTTLLHLLTHQNPGDLPQQRLKIDFRAHVTVSDSFADWLDALLEPLVEDRFDSAKDAIAALTNPTLASPRSAAQPRRSLPQVHKKPAGSRVQLTRRRQHLSLKVPPVGFRGEAVGIAIFAFFWNGFILFWTSMAVVSGAPIFFVLFSLPFWAVGLGMLGLFLNALVGHTSLEIERDRFILTQQILGWKRVTEGSTHDLEGVDLRLVYSQNDRPVKAITLHEGTRTHKFGTLLTNSEKAWLLSELEAFICEQVT